MRVGFLATLPPTKGISDYAHNFLMSTPDYLQLECYAISQLAPSLLYPGGDKVEDLECIINLPNNVMIQDSLTYYNLNRWVQVGFMTKSGLFHIHWWTPYLVIPYLLLMCILRARRIKVVLTIHNVTAHESRAFHWISTKLLLRLTNHVIVHTLNGKRDLAKKYRYNESRITILPHGLLKPPIGRDSQSKASARRLLGLPQSKSILLFFGNIRKYKGLDTLLEAMRTVVEADSNAILVVAGMPWTNRDCIKKTIRELHLDKHVAARLQFIHPSNLPLYFESADVVVLPYSRFDAQTGIGLYALHFEKPIVVTRVGGLPDLVLDDSVVVPPKNPRALADAILKVVGNPAFMAKLAEDSRSLKGEMGWEKIAEQTGEVYKDLLRGQ